MQSQVKLQGDSTVQVLSGASINFSGLFDAAGFSLQKQGPGSVSFTGGLNLAGGELKLFATEAATVTLSPSSQLAGKLTVLLEPGVAPRAGQSFELIAYSGAPVMFGDVILPALPAGLDWQLEYQPTKLIAGVVLAGLPGDFNGDGAVDAADYTMWRDGLGTTFDQSDYDVWRTNFGATLPASPSAQASTGPQAVPEPASLPFAIGMVALALRLREGFQRRE